MIELNRSIFYKVKFDIARVNPQTDLYWKIVLHIKNWLTQKHNNNALEKVPERLRLWSKLKTFGGTLTSMDQKSVSIECKCFDEGNAESMFWACRIIERPMVKQDFAPRSWYTEIGVEPVEEGKVSFSCVISYLDQPGFIGLCADEPDPNIPRFIKNIIGDGELLCTQGFDKISVDPEMMKTGNWYTFWERIKSSDRIIPYIYLSVKNDFATGAASLPINPQKLCIACGGNARVFYANDDGINEEMNSICASDYACYGGAIRVYFPRVNLDDPLDHFSHRYIKYDTILELGEDEIIRMFRRAFAQDFKFYESFLRIEDCERKRNEKRLQRVFEAEKEKYEKVLQERNEEHEEELDDFYNESLKAISERDEFKKENDDLKTQCYTLTQEVEYYRSLAQKNKELLKASMSRESIKEYPESPEMIAEYFGTCFADAIGFSDDAKKTLKECTIPNEELWKVFYALSTTMLKLYREGSGDFYDQFKSLTGIDAVRGEGRMTRKDTKLMEQFKTNYEGVNVNIEPHITYPSLEQSIHFGYSQEFDKIVIGSCGEHKEIYSSRKHK